MCVFERKHDDDARLTLAGEDGQNIRLSLLTMGLVAVSTFQQEVSHAGGFRRVHRQGGT